MKIEVKDERARETVPFQSIVVHEFFMYEGTLCFKTSTSGSNPNLIVVESRKPKVLGSFDKVEEIHGIEVKLLK